MRRKRRSRKRRGFVRPSRAVPRAGWSKAELAKLSGVPARTIALYLQRRVLPPVAFHGRGTRYERKHLLALLALQRLRATHGRGLKNLRARLSALNPAELESLATENLAPGPLADALGVQPAVTTARRGAALSANENDSAPEPIGARWQRIELALGLELNVREDASPGVLALARRVRELCSG